MKIYSKKRIDIFIEVPYLNRLTQYLDEKEVSGYTVLPALAGRGHEGSWSREGLVSDAGRLVVVMCILDEEDAESMLEDIYHQLEDRIGIVTICNVGVVRNEHF